MSLWSAMEEGIITAYQAREIAMPVHARIIENATRWIEHLTHRLVYERTLLTADGGLLTDQTAAEKGGACRSWIQGGRWLEILRVNKVSVTVTDNFGNGGQDFTRTVLFNQLKGILSPTQWKKKVTIEDDKSHSE